METFLLRGSVNWALERTSPRGRQLGKDGGVQRLLGRKEGQEAQT